jgi:hypothetical protein
MTYSKAAPPGTTLIAACGSLYGLAKRAYERTVAASDRAPQQHDALSAIILSVVSLEAFIGELEVATRFFAPHAPEAASRNRGRALVDALELIEEGKGQLTLKFQIAKFILTGKPYETGTRPYQHFDLLLDVRNGLIHPKPFAVKTDDSGSLMDPFRKFREKLRSLEITAEIPGENVVAPLSTWVQTKAAARWACNTAAEMAHSLFETSAEDSLVAALKTLLPNSFVRIP